MFLLGGCAVGLSTNAAQQTMEEMVDAHLPGCWRDLLGGLPSAGRRFGTSCWGGRSALPPSEVGSSQSCRCPAARDPKVTQGDTSGFRVSRAQQQHLLPPCWEDALEVPPARGSSSLRPPPGAPAQLRSSGEKPFLIFPKKETHSSNTPFVPAAAARLRDEESSVPSPLRPAGEAQEMHETISAAFSLSPGDETQILGSLFQTQSSSCKCM